LQHNIALTYVSFQQQLGGAYNISTLHGFLLTEKEKKNSTKWSSWQGLEMPGEKRKAYRKIKERGTSCPQHVKRDMVHTAKKGDSHREGPELAREDKNSTERRK